MLLFHAILASLATVSAQQVESNGCLRLLGSVACPGSPGNLTNAFPFFADVTDVRSFDAAALNYFSNPYQWEATKFENQLGCSNASDAVLRYQRTVLCSNWVNNQWSRECLSLYTTSQKMVCQSTCLDFAASENQVVNNTVGNFCPGPDNTNGNRTAQMTKDFTDCTDWTSLATNNSGSCVSGADNGENNCGYGSSTVQLCNHCSASEPDECCYSSNTDISVCGFALAPQSSSSGTASSTSASGSATAAPGNNQNGSSTLTGGKLAGTIVGSVLGGLLLLALLAFLLLCCRRRKRNNNRDSASSFAAGEQHQGMFGSMFPNRNSAQVNPSNSSEKGLLKSHGGPAAASTPTMGGDTLYSGHGRSTEGTGLGLAPAAMIGGAAAGATGDGLRNSGVVLPRVKDENQSGDRWIETGAEVSVLWPYQAALPDELDLRPGMKLKVLRLYDDAWGTARIVSGGQEGDRVEGSFPIVCVSEGSSFGTPSTSSEGSAH